jgi:hypothetical protein
MATHRNRTKSTIGSTVAGRYGNYEITGYEGSWRLEIYRPLVQIASEPWNNAVHERHMCTGTTDASPTVLGDAYDARCSCCWLNIPHTRAKHDQCVAAKLENAVVPS